MCTSSGLQYLLRHINSQVKHDGGVFEVLTTAKCSLGENVRDGGSFFCQGSCFVPPRTVDDEWSTLRPGNNSLASGGCMADIRLGILSKERGHESVVATNHA